MNTPLQQVLLGLALNRTPGWNFPGNFLEISFDAIDASSATLSIEPGPHCVDVHGALALAPLSVLLDIGMGGVMRGQVGPAERMATVAMSMQLTGVAAAGRITSLGRFDGYVQGASGRQGLMRIELRTAEGALVATGSGTFMALGNREGTAPLAMHKRGLGPAVAALRLEDLAPDEREIHDRAARAMEGGSGAFIDHFWGLVPTRLEDGASIEFTNGLHVGNRVGHTQGGITFALAAATAEGALGEAWKLVGIAASYVSPGTGPVLHSRATVVHQGRLTAVVRTRIEDVQGRLVLDATTNHARAG